MPANLRNNRFNFGFLNNNQDPVDIAESESPLLDSLDADDVALGSMRVSDYIDPASGPKDWTGATTEVKLGGRRFRLEPTTFQLQLEKNAGSADWENVNDDQDSAGVVNPNAFPPKAIAPTLTSVQGVSITPMSGSTDIPLIAWRINPTSAYSGLQTESYILEIQDDTLGAITWKWKFGFDLTFREFNIPLAGGTYVDIGANRVQVNLPTEVDQTAGPSGAYVIGDTASTTVSKDVLPDGVYSYLIVNIKKTGITPEIEIQGLPSETSTANIANFDGAGNPIQGGPLVTRVTYPALANNTDEMWLFRKGPDDDEYFRIDVSTLGGVSIDDTIEAVSLVPLIILDSEEDESFFDLNVAIGNPSQEFNKLFEKDNRLWLVPEDRQDLVLYSRLGDWWGWQRVNSFSFIGNITDIAQVRDPTVVGGEFTTVFGTEEGIFHITGNGTEPAPYTRVEAVSDIFVEANSLVDMNGILMLTSRSATGIYDEGPYGQKVYEYNLQSLIEVSSRVKESPFITSIQDIEYAEMRGSDKYIVKKVDVDEILLYHRDIRGWVQVTQAGEDDGWSWRSKKFTPIVFERMPIAYARLMKLDFIGKLKVQFTLEGINSATPEVVSITYDNAQRQEVFQRLPALKGRKWFMDLTTELDPTTILYDFYFVD